MGWDAYSSKDLRDEAQKIAFELASKRVIEKCGSVDGSLETGGLGLSTSARMLSLASEQTGEGYLGFYFHPYQDDPVTPEQVKVLAELLIWNFEFTLPREEKWAFWSAREFINVCAELELGIRFSY